MNTVVENDDNDVEIKCIFCGKDLDDRREMVRFRGAIACKECAEKQEPTSSSAMKPFVYLAGIGSFIGMLTFMLFTLRGLLFASLDYIEPVDLFFTGMMTTFVAIAFGLYAINRIHFHIASIIGMVTALIAAIFSGLAVLDFVTNGPYFVVEEITYTKTIYYYPATLPTFTIFFVVVALSILMHMTNTKTEYVSIASAGMMFVSAGMALFSWGWFLPGFVTAFAFALTFVFFVSRKRIFEEEDIQPLSSLDG